MPYCVQSGSVVNYGLFGRSLGWPAAEWKSWACGPGVRMSSSGGLTAARRFSMTECREVIAT